MCARTYVHGCTDLCLRQVELPGQLRALPANHVLAALELHLQPVQLLGREGGAGPFGPVQVQTLGQQDLPDGAFGIWEEHKERRLQQSSSRGQPEHTPAPGTPNGNNSHSISATTANNIAIISSVIIAIAINIITMFNSVIAIIINMIAIIFNSVIAIIIIAVIFLLLLI